MIWRRFVGFTVLDGVIWCWVGGAGLAVLCGPRLRVVVSVFGLASYGVGCLYRLGAGGCFGF